MSTKAPSPVCLEQLLGIGTDDLDGQLTGVAQDDVAPHLPVHLVGGGVVQPERCQPIVAKHVLGIVIQLHVGERIGPITTAPAGTFAVDLRSGKWEGCPGRATERTYPTTASTE